MNKICYNSNPFEDEKLISTPLPEEYADKESATEMGNRSFNLIDNTINYDAAHENINENDSEQYESSDFKTNKELLDLLLLLGDDMDKNNEEVLSNFSDFLIKKIAETEKIDYTKMFNQLMIKINNADLPNTSEIIKKLCKIYSKTLLIEYMQNKNLDKSKESAYKKILHRADQYISEE